MSAPPVAIMTAEQIAVVVREQVDAALSERERHTDSGPMLLTCSKLCKKLGVSRASVYRWRAERMPAVKCGDEWRYELDAVMAWLRGRK